MLPPRRSDRYDFLGGAGQAVAAYDRPTRQKLTGRSPPSSGMLRSDINAAGEWCSTG